MAKSQLIIVTGPPGTGKTTLGQRVADTFHLPFINKDGIKELLYDTLGWSDREWSKRLGASTYAILYFILAAEVRAGASLVIESNFDPALANDEFVKLRERYGYDAFQIVCVADGDVLFDRFKARAASGERHPGHGDELNYNELEEILRRGRYAPLDLEGTVYEVDMTDLGAIDYEALYAAVRAFLAKGGE